MCVFVDHRSFLVISIINSSLPTTVAAAGEMQGPELHSGLQWAMSHDSKAPDKEQLLSIHLSTEDMEKRSHFQSICVSLVESCGGSGEN